jgi:murein DD-endopeptidase / murein LD-carboxypeptidase
VVKVILIKLFLTQVLKFWGYLKAIKMNIFFKQLKKSLHYFLPLLIAGSLLTACSISQKTSKTDHSEKKESDEARAASEAEKALAEKYATLLNVEIGKLNNYNLYKFIDDWQGVPYKYGGRSKTGIDCSNLTSLLYNQVFSKDISGSCSSLFSQTNPINVKDLKEGDLVFFKIDGDKISHVGVYLHNNKFVHATTKKGVMINDLNEPYYKKYFYNAARIKH